MPIVTIRNQPIEVDVETELREFDWTRSTWTSDKLLAASPFRDDHTPSFFVRLEPYGDYPAGTWSDSGAYDTFWGSGGIVKLLAFLRNETYEETEEYLLDAYGFDYDSEKLTLVAPKLAVPKSGVIELSRDRLANFSQDFTYLRGRGISEEVQRQAGVCFDSRSNAVVIPWFDAQKRLRNVKFRATWGKVFWYTKGATPVRELVYGIESITESTAVLEEAEIDALSWRTAGVQAIAVGGANFTDDQADIIKRSPIKTLLIGGDNDKVGEKFAEQVADKLRGYVELRRIEKPTRFKDANEALIAGENLRNYQSRPISSINVDKLRPNFANTLL